MSNTPDPAGLPESVEYQPLPNIYRAFAAGASPYAIITETIDNSIDFVRSQALDGVKHPNRLEAEIRYELDQEDNSLDPEDIANIDDGSDGRLVIIDNAGGVPPRELSKFFQLGHTDAPPQGIGRFGVGAKRLIGIGNRIRYESHAHGYEVAGGFEVDARDLEGNDDNELESEDVYRSEVYSVEDLPEGHTRIIIEDLNENVWANLLGLDEDNEVDRSAADSLWHLGATYEHFLREGISIATPTDFSKGSIDFHLEWSGPNHQEDISTPDQTEFSWLPLDGLHPRQYRRLPFGNTENTPEEEQIRADITVGLMSSSDPTNAGLTVAMNNRNVLFRDTNNGLFSTRYLGKFRESQGHGRLVCKIDLDGPAENMPWSDTKDGLDGTQEVTSHILNVAENALSEYRRQGYEPLPKWILAAYADSTLDTIDDKTREEIPSEVEQIDKSSSKVNTPRFNSKPGSRSDESYYRVYPERDTIIKQVRLHSELRINCSERVARKALPAYDRYFATEYTGPTRVDIEASEAPDVDAYEIPTDNDEIPLIKDIQQLAESHASQGQKLTDDTAGVPLWLLPRYEEEWAEDGDADKAETIEVFDFEEWREEHSVSEKVRIERSDPRQMEATNSRVFGGNQENSGQRLETDRPGRQSPDRDGDRDGATQSANNRDLTGGLSGFQESSSSQSAASGGQAESNVGTPTVPDTRIDQETLSELQQILGIEESTSVDDLVEAALTLKTERDELRENLKEVRQFVNLEQLLEDPPSFEDE